MPDSFDFIVVGGGTAGCVLANRLSAEPGTSVALVEAGGASQSPWVGVPAGFSRLLRCDRHNWRLATEPEAGTAHRTIAIPRGKGLLRYPPIEERKPLKAPPAPPAHGSTSLPG